MNAGNRQGTFWVMDGVRVKKKQPFIITETPRTLQNAIPKPIKNQETPIVVNEPVVAVGEKYFFTEKSYEDFADKRMDYGMIHFSSLSSMRGDIFSWGQNHEIPHNFSAYGSSDQLREGVKRSIFENQFCGFEYV